MAFSLLPKEYIIYDETVTVFEPDSNAILTSYRNGLIPFPYWSKVWPAAIALARFLHTHPHYTHNKRVLELAAGLGLPSIVAARNATSVIASDYAEDAVTAMQQTVGYSSLQNIGVRLLDWFTLPVGLAADVLLLSDVSYDAVLFNRQEEIIRQFLQQGTVVILSTPQRLVAKAAITPLLSFCTCQEEMMIADNHADVIISVMVLQNS